MRTLAKELTWLGYFLLHPLSGFWELKREKRGSMCTGGLLLALYCLVTLASAWFTSYMFNPYETLEIQAARVVLPGLVLYLLWCIASWCLTSLFDGEGSFLDICVATAYALLPLLIVQTLLIGLSYVMTMDEGALYTLVQTLGYIWTGFLLFTGTMVTQQYTFSKSLLICVCTLLGMCVIVYIALLFTGLLQQMLGFAAGLYNEWILR